MKLLLLFALSLLATVPAYHILCVFPVPTRSHNTLGKGIVDSLLSAGHEVSWATPYPPKEAKKGLNIIDVSATVPIFESLDMVESAKLGIAGLSLVKSYSRNVSLTALTPQMRSTLTKTQFDAVVTEIFFNEVDSGYAAVQQVPWIVLSGINLQPALQSQIDAAHSVPIIPMMFTNFPTPMNFWQRLVTAGIYLGMKSFKCFDDSVNSKHYEEMFGSIAAARGVKLPSYEEAHQNISVLLLNSHPSFAPAQSLPPNAVEIAGYHIDENIPPLPKDLQDLLDSSTRGVIYFSMGSVLKSASFPVKTRQELLKVFGALPYTVLWKFEEQLEGLPKNVNIRKWMPQPSILAHPNIKVFITHGGILSNLEALYHGVPLISMPLYGDQPSNANKAAQAGYAIKIDYDFDTMAAQLKVALTEIMGTDKYYKQAKYLSTLFNNRPVAPSKLISHYIEVAIKSKGAYHLRSKALLYPWYQRCMLDLVAFVFFVLLAVYIILKNIARFVINLCTGSNGKKVKIN